MLAMETNTNTFVEEVLAQFTDTITDQVFLMVENSAPLAARYRALATDDNAQHTLNCQLGRRIREHFDLRNMRRCHEPESTLIKSYERHARK
jgi:hypothetical protein